MLIVHSLLLLVLSSYVTPQPALLYNWIQPPPAPLYMLRPPLLQMPYYHTPAHPLQQGPGLVVSLCSEQGASFPHPVFYDKYQLCSGSVEDGWKVT